MLNLEFFFPEDFWCILSANRFNTNLWRTSEEAKTWSVLFWRFYELWKKGTPCNPTAILQLEAGSQLTATVLGEALKCLPLEVPKRDVLSWAEPREAHAFLLTQIPGWGMDGASFPYSGGTGSGLEIWSKKQTRAWHRQVLETSRWHSVSHTELPLSGSRPCAEGSLCITAFRTYNHLLAGATVSYTQGGPRSIHFLSAVGWAQPLCGIVK